MRLKESARDRMRRYPDADKARGYLEGYTAGIKHGAGDSVAELPDPAGDVD